VSAAELEILRRAFARQMMLHAGAPDAALERAFATIPREDFLGNEPWCLVRPGGGETTLPVNDPVYLYQDALFSLAPGSGINNGSPSLHARMLHALAVRPGQRVVHLGAGTGYYTALLAELTGAGGRVTAVEFDGKLAGAARDNVARWRQVEVVEDDAERHPEDMVDRIYVNFGVARPASAWLEKLRPEGRLVFPLGVAHPGVRGPRARFAAQGAALLVERRGERFAASFVCTAWFILAAGALRGDEAEEAALHRAFERGGVEFVKSLRRAEPVDPARCWHWTPEWSLSFDPQ
jgi:protein-L-isoaspartate(D-aspartate) O-methyltransferase